MGMAIIRLPVITKRTKGITRKIMMTMKRKMTIIVPIRGMKKKRMKKKTMIVAAVEGTRTSMNTPTRAGLRNVDVNLVVAGGNPALTVGALPLWTATRLGGTPVRAGVHLMTKEEGPAVTKADADVVNLIRKGDDLPSHPAEDGLLNPLPGGEGVLSQTPNGDVVPNPREEDGPLPHRVTLLSAVAVPGLLPGINRVILPEAIPEIPVSSVIHRDSSPAVPEGPGMVGGGATPVAAGAPAAGK